MIKYGVWRIFDSAFGDFLMVYLAFLRATK